MAYEMLHEWDSSAWTVAARQHGVITRGQLLALGLSSGAIVHRVKRGRLHPIWRGVYAVGRPHVDRLGMWMAAVLACGPGSVLSHESAAGLWGIRPDERTRIDVSLSSGAARRTGIDAHRRRALQDDDVTRRDGIPVTSPACTLIDLAARLEARDLERAVSETDKLNLVHPESLRRALDQRPRRRGARALRMLLDFRTFTVTDSELERRLLPLARKASLPTPETGRSVNGFRVDFLWPELGLVVETDGLRYHRTPSQQARDRFRDHSLAAAGLTCCASRTPRSGSSRIT